MKYGSSRTLLITGDALMTLSIMKQVNEVIKPKAKVDSDEADCIPALKLIA